MERRSVSSALTKNFGSQSETDCEDALAAWQADRKARSTLKGTVERAAQENRISDRQAAPQSGRATGPKNWVDLDAMNSNLESLLYPHKGPQERELCLLPFWRDGSRAG